MDGIASDFNFSQEALVNPAPLDLAEAWGVVDQLNVNLESLNAVYCEVSLEGRISRGQAEFLIENCGLDFGPNYPLHSFTEDPTATNLAIATEAAGSNLLNTISEFIKKVVSIIVNILKWIYEILTGYSSRRQNVTRVAENLVAVAKTNREVEAAMAKLPTPASNAQHPTTKHEKLQQAMNRFDESWSDFREQIITQGDYIQFLRQFSVYILAFMPQLTQRVETFKKLIEQEEKPGDAGHQVALKAQFARLMEPVPTAPLQRILQHAHLGLGNGYSPLSKLHDPSFLEVAVAVNQRFTTLVQAKSTDPVQVTQCAELIDNNIKIIDPYLVQDHQQRALIEGLIQDYKKILGLHPRQAYSDELREQYKAVVDQLTNEVKALQLLVDTYNQADLENIRFFTVLASAVFAYNEALEERIGLYPEASQKVLRENISKGRSLLKKLVG